MSEINKAVWIVIPSWNRRADLIACLDSLKDVTYSPIQILVIDNASQDGTFKAISNQFPEVIIKKMEKNIGASAASNFGFDFALDQGADYILRLDSDTIVSADFLEPLVTILEQNKDIGVVSPKIYYYEPADLIWYAGVDAHPWHFGAINDMKNKRDNNTSCRSRDVDYVWGAAMLIRREVLEKTGGFDTDFFIYYEEVDFCKRAQELGFSLFFTPESKIWHKVGSENMSPMAIYQWNRSKVILFRKHAKNPMHRLLLIVYAFIYAFASLILRPKKLRHLSFFKSTFEGLNAGLKLKIETEV